MMKKMWMLGLLSVMAAVLFATLGCRTTETEKVLAPETKVESALADSATKGKAVSQQADKVAAKKVKKTEKSECLKEKAGMGKEKVNAEKQKVGGKTTKEAAKCKELKAEQQEKGKKAKEEIKKKAECKKTKTEAGSAE